MFFLNSSILQIPGESTLKRNFQLIQSHEARPNNNRSSQQQHQQQQQHKQHKGHHHDRGHGGHNRDNRGHHHPQDNRGHRPPSSNQAWPVSSHFQAQPTPAVQQLPKQVPKHPQLIGKTFTEAFVGFEFWCILIW